MENNWISVKDRLPEADAEYLVCNADGVIRVSYFDGTHWGYLASVREDINFWQPLPETPKQ